MTTNIEMIKQHPTEIASVVRDKTFYISSDLYCAGLEDESYPLMTYGKFSRYEFCAIDENKKALSAKIRIEEIRSILRKSKELYKMDFAKQFEEKGNTNLSPAYTVQIKGKFNNLTPAQYLKENPNGLQELVNQKSYLEQHLVGKYAQSNQNQINAIIDAYNLYVSGQLDLNNVAGIQECVVYDGGMRPLVNRKVPTGVKPGCSFVYSMKITWNIGTDNPINVKIDNYYAPVIKTDKGLYNVNFSERDVTNYNSITFKMSVDEWMNSMENVEMDMRRFETVNYKKTYDEAKKLDTENKRAYTQQNQYNNVAYAPLYNAQPVQSVQMQPQPVYNNWNGGYSGQ